MDKKWTFSKVVMALVMATYYWGVIFGAYIVYQDHIILPEYLAYIGTPVAVAIGFYSWKAKAENVTKIKLSREGVNKCESY
ncbi:hypothetical protein LPY66_18105 [Dehalobacter sp. DCM]|uniref:hypothetical protein n=1 Tax=Dehalobacter sp. DCM TaxID=2907827 RepID=UPI003081CD1E|nr:hypothetical protein LPY66_18105 [Dehalobacter sp. DCM]